MGINTEEKLRELAEEAQTEMDKITDELAADMNNTNEDMDIALADLLDFMQKNDAQIPESETYDLILAREATPTVDRRKAESKTLLTNSVKYVMDFELRMAECCTNISAFFRDLGAKVDQNKDKLRQTEIQFQVAMESATVNSEEAVDNLEADLAKKTEEMRRSINH